MATYTTNLNLKKPAANEMVDITDINGNMNLIDSAFGSVQSALASTKFVRKSCASNASLTYTFSNSCAFVAFCSGASPSAKIIILGNCTTAGSVSYQIISPVTTSLTVSTETFVLTVENGSSATLSVSLVLISGTAPT